MAFFTLSFSFLFNNSLGYAEGHSEAFLAARMRGREKHMKDIYEEAELELPCNSRSILVQQSDCVLYYLPKKKKHSTHSLESSLLQEFVSLL